MAIDIYRMMMMMLLMSMGLQILRL